MNKNDVVIAIDPGLKGAMVLTDCREFLSIRNMPLVIGRREIHYQILREILQGFGAEEFPVVLERAIPMAMGSAGAFTYGRGYERIIRAVEVAGCSPRDIVIVEPAKWTKEMHQGISKDLKPKAKSLVAVHRLYPNLVKYLPRKKNGELMDGPVDALLLAGYGLRRFEGFRGLAFEPDSEEDHRILAEAGTDFR